MTSVRPLQSTDMLIVADLAKRLHLTGSPPTWEDMVKPHVLALGLMVDEKLMGYAEGWVAGPEANLNAIVVHPDLEGQGLGALLLKTWMSQIFKLGCEEIHLELASPNQRARQLYEASGFIQVGERTGYYADGTSALLFTLKELPTP